MPKTTKATQQRIHSVTTDTTFPDGRQTCARCGLTITDAGKEGFAPQAILEELVDGQPRFRIFTADDASKEAVPCEAAGIRNLSVS